MTNRLSPSYWKYITSEDWFSNPARLQELELAGHRCRFCGRGADEAKIEVHHKTYARFGCELVSDLTAVCSDDHKVLTAEMRRRRSAARSADASGNHRARGR